MISRVPAPRRRDTLRGLLVPATAALCLLGLPFAAGCGDEPQQVVNNAPPPAPPPPPPAPPKVKTIADLMAELNIDSRIYMDEATAPASTDDRVAVLEFFDAFVRGKSDRVRGMLAPSDREYVDLMVDIDAWDPMVEAIEDVQLVAGVSPDSRPAIIGMFVRDAVDEYQMWYFEQDETGTYAFEAAPTPPNIAEQLSGEISGYVAMWHQILDDELALASVPDEVYVIQEDLDPDSESAPSGGQITPGGGPSPSGPGGGRHRPSGPKRKPPGIPGPGG